MQDRLKRRLQRYSDPTKQACVPPFGVANPPPPPLLTHGVAWELVFDCEQVATRAAANRKPMRLASSDTTTDAETAGGTADGKVRMVPGPS